MSNDTNFPPSPNALESGIRGRIEGVTRIGPRAMLLGFLVIVALLGGILFGMLRTPKAQAQRAASTVAIVAPPQPSTAPHFGENVPIVESPPPATPPPVVLLPPSPPPPPLPPQDPNGTAPVALQAASAGTAAPAEAAAPPVAVVREQSRAEAGRQRRLDDERARSVELKRAFEAPILAGNGNGSGSASQPAPPPVAGAQAATPAATSNPGGAGANAASGSSALGYLAGPTGQYAPTPATQAANGTRNATLPGERYAPSTSFELTAGSVVPAALVTGIDSEQPGLVTGQVREDVYDAKTGRYLLIPRGSRLIGVYKSDVGFGKSRVLVAWQRLIFPDTSSIDLLNMTGADVQGGGGLGGKVDNHTGQLIGATLLSSVLAAGVALSQPRTQTVATTAGGSVAVPSAGQAAAQGVGQQLADVGQSLIQKNLSIPPVVHVPKGYPFLVVVDRDIVFPGPYGQGS